MKEMAIKNKYFGVQNVYLKQKPNLPNNSNINEFMN